LTNVKAALLNAMQIDERLSPAPALQQLRALHPVALQHLQQSPDASLYGHAHHQALPQLHHGNNAVYHQQQYVLNGPPQPAPHALQYQHHALPGSPAQYAAYPAPYQHATSPRYGPVQQLQSSPQATQQQLPLPPPPPIRTVPQQPIVQPYQRQIQQQVQTETRPEAQAPEGDDAPSSSHAQFQDLKLVAEPPDLEAWRQKLFDVDETITLNEDECVRTRVFL
jgi:glutathione S-transferase